MSTQPEYKTRNENDVPTPQALSSANRLDRPEVSVQLVVIQARNVFNGMQNKNANFEPLQPF